MLTTVISTQRKLSDNFKATDKKLCLPKKNEKGTAFFQNTFSHNIVQKIHSTPGLNAHGCCFYFTDHSDISFPVTSKEKLVEKS